MKLSETTCSFLAFFLRPCYPREASQTERRSEIRGRAYAMTIATEKSDMTVGEVKLQLQNTYLIPADHQRLFFSGVYLDNSRLLSAYGIGHNSILELVVNFNGHRRSLRTGSSAGRKAKKMKEVPINGGNWVYAEDHCWDDMGQNECSPWMKTTWSAQTNTTLHEASEVSHDEDDAVWSYTPTSGPSEISDPQDPTDITPNYDSITATKSGADDIVERMLKTGADIELLADEVHKACDIVTEVTAAKRDLSLKIDALEGKLAKAHKTMKELSIELAEAVDTMAKESHRLRSAVRDSAMGH